MSSKTQEYKGHPVISLLDETKEDGKNIVVTFGIRKATAILKHVEDIQKFIDANVKK